MESRRDHSEAGVEVIFGGNPFYQAVIKRMKGMGVIDDGQLAAMRAAIEQGVDAEAIDQATTTINTLSLADWFAIFFLQRFFAHHEITAACAEEALKEANNTAVKRHQSDTPVEELVDIRELGRRMRAQGQLGA